MLVMYVYRYMYMSMCMCMCMCMLVMYVYRYMYMSMCMCMCMCMLVMYVYRYMLCIGIYVCVCVYMYVHVYVSYVPVISATPFLMRQVNVKPLHFTTMSMPEMSSANMRLSRCAQLYCVPTIPTNSWPPPSSTTIGTDRCECTY